MKTPSARNWKLRGFTLVEMIGVLAVLALMISVLVPRIFQTISDSKIANAAATCANIKIAVNEHYGRYGRLAGVDGNQLSLAPGAIFEDWDRLALIPDGFAEKNFIVRIGNGAIGWANGGSRLRVVNIQNNDVNTPAASSLADLDAGAYDLDGSARTNDVVGGLLIEAVIEGVDQQDARAFNDRLDGPGLGASSGNDSLGRVKYFITTNATVSVRVYVAHK